MNELWGFEIKRGMGSEFVVSLDGVADGFFGGIVFPKTAILEHFFFDGPVHSFGQCVFAGAVVEGHAYTNFERFQPFDIAIAAILGPPVGVVKQAREAFFLPDAIAISRAASQPLADRLRHSAQPTILREYASVISDR